ncbi:Uma2 family endonuclease [Desulfofundulus kuznetsovii]|uniref:Uma2 family endonuclease n=1 Tax=Desulfofundulus kuznetsovii TaxID=58135 RepID=UPI0002F38CDF
MYYTTGVKEYWLIDPAVQLAEVFAREDKGWYRAGVYDEEDTLVSPLLPFWSPISPSPRP